MEDYDGVVMTVPREATNVAAIEDEFFMTMTNSAVYGKRGQESLLPSDRRFTREPVVRRAAAQ